MRKLLLVLLLFISYSLNAIEISPEDQQKIIAQIEARAASINTLQCEFIQTKETAMLEDKLTSHGKVYFKAEGGKLHWEYTKPNQFLLVINGELLKIESEGSVNIIKLSQNKMFGMIAKIIMNSLTGNCLSSTSDFRVELTKQDKIWVAELTPLRREIQTLFNTLRFYLKEDLSMISKVEMIEKRGDSTIIEMKNIKINSPIDDKVFSIK